MNRPAMKYPELKDAYVLLDGLALLKRKQEQEEAPMIVCAWCGTVKRDGALPASHGICDDCAEKEFGSAFQRSAGNEPPPRSPIHDGYGTQRRAWPAWSVMLWSLSFLWACGLSAQVTAVAEMRNGVAELRIGNPTASPLAVDLSIYRDATKDGQPVTLGDSVAALISPRSFVLQPGQLQVVRIRVRDSVKVGELLRPAILFTPQAPDSSAGMRLLVRTRLITKLRVAAL
jgi:hypothetical protein